jgi:hypothetical protein
MLREWTAAGLALVVVAGTAILAVVTAMSASSAEIFARLKDLLLFLNPLVGLVIGYYFNRVTSEKRAESSEKRAENAESVAQKTSEAAQEAGRGRAKAEERTEEMSSSLADLTRAVSDGARGGNRTLGGATAPADPELQAALRRARATLGWGPGS